jgi:hypothetical protein
LRERTSKCREGKAIEFGQDVSGITPGAIMLRAPVKGATEKLGAGQPIPNHYSPGRDCAN